MALQWVEVWENATGGEDADAEIPVIWLCTCIHYDTLPLRQGHSAKEASRDDRGFRRELETQGCDEAVGADAGWGDWRRRKRYRKWRRPTRRQGSVY
ncbi:hypothetical protein FIBSPDRAFT_855116 [Athelia psychrophila]|uniref:Uncharacterized protein n=1 Tax=Athelia psychrophila TaxID=1759441 RepID=A0A166PJC8_9AGAM|nr:hypothetical protein FIBSPDRAFT_855116 [Fibularhizoctonia sp. CBS 109695]